MAFKLSPEILVGRFIKSATNGKKISIKLKRILTLIVFPLGVICLVGTSVKCYTGISALIYGKKLKYGTTYDENKRPISADTFYLDTGRFKSEIYLNKAKRDLLIYLPSFLLIGFILPWVVPRLIFWIKDADELKD